jgi:DNA-binding response OmpR family regulator
MHILLLEDEAESAHLLKSFLELNGFTVTHVRTGTEALPLLNVGHDPLDAAILDVMVPELDGLELLQHLRAHPAGVHIPVLFLTARDREQDEIEGLALGADDYITKPASLNRILARLQNLLRRTAEATPVPVIAAVEHSPLPVRLDIESRLCFVVDQPVELTGTEFQLLHLLLGQPGRVFTRQEILEHISEEGRPVFDRTVDAHVKNLRHKLGHEAELIRTVRGIGYALGHKPMGRP